MLLSIVAALGGGPKLAVSGETIIDTQITATDAFATLIFNTDGTVDKEITSGVTQIDPATDWILPNNAASSAYQVRAQDIVWDSSGDGESFSISSIPTDNTWADLGTIRKLQIIQASDTPAVKQVTFTLELRIGTGPVVLAASYTLKAEVTA